MAILVLLWHCPSKSQTFSDAPANWAFRGGGGGGGGGEGDWLGWKKEIDA